MNQSPEEETPQLLSENPNNKWPDLSSGNSSTKGTDDDSSEEWENLSSDELLDVPKEFQSSARHNLKKSEVNKNLFHRCMSTPEFSHLDDEESYVIDNCSESVDAQSLATNSSTCDDAVLLSHKNKSAMKKVPSFKDIMMLNAQSQAKEESKKKEMRINQEQKLRKEAAQRRKASRPKLIISPIKRCTKSTGDLRSMIIHEHSEDDDGYEGGGGGGGGGGGTIHEHEVLGDTDAMEFYNRKSKGSLNRQNGSKIRPDEAKRKKMIIHKKNAQRKSQQARTAK